VQKVKKSGENSKTVEENNKGKWAQAGRIWTIWWIKGSRFNHSKISSEPQDQMIQRLKKEIHSAT